MMDRKRKLGKISVTVFLTALIWVWADLAQDERLDLSNFVTVTMAKSSDPNLWVALEDDNSVLRASLTVERVVLKGPASRIGEVVRRKNREKLDLNLFRAPDRCGPDGRDARSTCSSFSSRPTRSDNWADGGDLQAEDDHGSGLPLKRSPRKWNAR
jgi:hypothetical protein